MSYICILFSVHVQRLNVIIILLLLNKYIVLQYKRNSLGGSYH